jgi:hypothetical protein
VISYRSLLEGAATLDPRPPGPIADAIAGLVNEIRGDRKRRHPPLELVRPQDELRPLVAEAERLDQEVPGGLGLPMLRSLLMFAHPRIYILTEGERQADGRRVIRFSTAGAYRTPANEILAGVMDISFAKAGGRVWETTVTQATTWFRLIPNPGAQQRYDLAVRLEEVYLNLERPAAVASYRSPGQASEVLWLGSLPRGSVPPRWADRLRAIAATHGVNMRVIAQPATQRSEMMDWVTGQGVHVVTTWGTGGVIDEVKRAFEHSHPTWPLIELSGESFNEMFEHLRLELDEALATWQEAPAGMPIPADRIVYLQKKGTAGDHDQFDPRANPCNHNGFQIVQHADKALKGVVRMFGVRPASVSKCLAAGCSCWMARF